MYDLVLLMNTLVQAESQLHSLKQAAGGIGSFVNAEKQSPCEGTFSTLSL